jgi:hypothetical protein
MVEDGSLNINRRMFALSAGGKPVWLCIAVQQEVLLEQNFPHGKTWQEGGGMRGAVGRGDTLRLRA